VRRRGEQTKQMLLWTLGAGPLVGDPKLAQVCLDDRLIRLRSNGFQSLTRAGAPAGHVLTLAVSQLPLLTM